LFDAGGAVYGDHEVERPNTEPVIDLPLPLG
jgi:hypothetical protein